jgi:hypothetical protein|tara:strand:+ start:778 stop:1014 length:237 start_codon:yes stop_codon:yes gene_type:complete
MESEKSTDNDIQNVIKAISGGDNIAAQASFDQVMQMKTQDALSAQKLDMAGNMFTPPEPTAGIDTGITGDPAEVEEEE